MAILYNVNDQDADDTAAMVENVGGECLKIKSDVRNSAACQSAIEQTVEKFGAINILVNNAAYQMCQMNFLEISDEQFRQTMKTNVFGYFYMAKAAVPLMKAGDTIINTGSIIAIVRTVFNGIVSKKSIHPLKC